MIKTFQRDTFSVRVNRHKGEIFYCLFDITRSLKMKNGKTIKNAIERAYKCQLKKFKIDNDHYSFLTQEQLEYFLRLYSASADFNAFIREIPYWYKSQEAKEVIAKESQVAEPQASVPSVVNSVGSISKVDNATSLQVFNYGHSTLDYGILNGEPVFNLNYIGALLEIANPRMSIDISDKDYVVKIDNSVVSFTYNRNLNNRGELFLTEAGLYRLLLRSNKPEAEKFSKWVTKEVLPNLRKNGGYIVGQENMTPEQILANAMVVAQNIINSQKQTIAYQGEKLNDYKAVEKKRRSKLELANAINKNVKLLAKQKFNKQYANAYNYIYSIFASHHNISVPIDMPYLKKNNDYLEEVLRIVLAELD